MTKPNRFQVLGRILEARLPWLLRFWPSSRSRRSIWKAFGNITKSREKQ